jgi:acetaldehyde/propanal dehydrogenase
MGEIRHMNKLHVAILGSGNIATDLLVKARRSEWVDPLWMVGIDPASAGLAKARQLGVNTTADGIDGLLSHLGPDDIVIALDATSAAAHRQHAPRLLAAGVNMIDLTPAALGSYYVPAVSAPLQASTGPININMVSCGGQATIPLIASVSQVQALAYGEVIATVASRSVGPGTRQNIDEFTRTTADGIERVGAAQRGKAMVVINPAEPPIMMRNTVHCLTSQTPDREAIGDSIEAMVAQVRSYVPGYKLITGPLFDGCKVSVAVEVQGLGDYLPRYAGNLDIMTAAALHAAEELAQLIVQQGAR